MEHQWNVGEKGYNAYVPLPTTDDPPKLPPYTREQEDRYPSQNQYEGGYQYQGYPPQGGYRNMGGGPEGQGFQNQGNASFGQGHQNQGYPPQEHAQIQQPRGSSFQSYNSTREVVQVSRMYTRGKITQRRTSHLQTTKSRQKSSVLTVKYVSKICESSLCMQL